ncbi:recombinase family protein [Streptomyces virginiae]|uniref:recombinase family protein n=1 Tax=Streptomyces virginiae TaxID=1961 RepID=UPI00368D389B
MHEHKRLGRGIDLATLAEELRSSDVGLEFLTGELKDSHDPGGVVFTVLAALSGMEREYTGDRALEGPARSEPPTSPSPSTARERERPHGPVRRGRGGAPASGSVSPPSWPRSPG